MQKQKKTFEKKNEKKKIYINIYTIIGILVTQIDKVFGAASHKKVWDHFSKAQRKNIDLWKKQSEVSSSKHIKLNF